MQYSACRQKVCAAVPASLAAGQDVAVVISNDSAGYGTDPSTAVMIDSNLRCKEIREPLLNMLLVTDSAMAAAGGKLYLVGGQTQMQEQCYPTSFEVYDPHVSAEAAEA
jgi:hypothetical protein